jgi:hypothetical protein
MAPPWNLAWLNLATSWKVASPNPALSWKVALSNQAMPRKLAPLNRASAWKLARLNMARPRKLALLNEAAPWKLAWANPATPRNLAPPNSAVLKMGRSSLRGIASRTRASSSALMTTPRASMVPSLLMRLRSASKASGACSLACVRHQAVVGSRMAMQSSWLHRSQDIRLLAMSRPIRRDWKVVNVAGIVAFVDAGGQPAAGAWAVGPGPSPCGQGCRGGPSPGVCGGLAAPLGCARRSR